MTLLAILNYKWSQMKHEFTNTFWSQPKTLWKLP